MSVFSTLLCHILSKICLVHPKCDLKCDQNHINVHVNKSNPNDSIIEANVQSLTKNVNFILSFSPTANKNKIRDAHRKLMILNHPDRGETPHVIKWKSYKSLQALNSSEVLFVFLRQGGPHIWQQKSTRLKIYLMDRWRNRLWSNVWTSPVWCTCILMWSLNTILSSRSDLLLYAN